MVWTQEEEHKHLKSPYTKYSVGLTYTVWVDVDAKDQDEAIDLACNSNYSIDVKSKDNHKSCLLYTSPSPRDGLLSRMPSSA